MSWHWWEPLESHPNQDPMGCSIRFQFKFKSLHWREPCESLSPGLWWLGFVPVPGIGMTVSFVISCNFQFVPRVVQIIVHNQGIKYVHNQICSWQTGRNSQFTVYSSNSCHVMALVRASREPYESRSPGLWAQFISSSNLCHRTGESLANLDLLGCGLNSFPIQIYVIALVRVRALRFLEVTGTSKTFTDWHTYIKTIVGMSWIRVKE